MDHNLKAIVVQSPYEYRTVEKEIGEHKIHFLIEIVYMIRPYSITIKPLSIQLQKISITKEVNNFKDMLPYIYIRDFSHK